MISIRGRPAIASLLHEGARQLVMLIQSCSNSTLQLLIQLLCEADAQQSLSLAQR